MIDFMMVCELEKFLAKVAVSTGRASNYSEKFHRTAGLRRRDLGNLGGELGQRGAGFLPFFVGPRGRRVKLDARQMIVTFAATPPRALKVQGFADLIGRYRRANLARQALAEADRMPATTI